MDEDLRTLTRRGFLEVLTGLGAAFVAGCATELPRFADGNPGGRGVGAIRNTDIKDSYFKVYPRVLVGFYEHPPIRGIDLYAGYGAPVTAPIVCNVLEIPSKTDVYNRLVLETDLGHIIQLAGFSKINVQPNDRVTPFTILGEEGDREPSARISTNVTHTHIHVFLPSFAGLEGIEAGVEWHENVSKGLRYKVDNPNTQSLTGRLIDSNYQGDDSRIIQSTKEAEIGFNAIGEKYPKTHVGWFINNSKGERFFPRVSAVYKIYENGLMDNEELKRDVFEYLRWHANIKMGLSLPYPNSQLSDRYIIPKSDPSRIEEVKALAKIAHQKSKENRWREALIDYERIKKLSPFWSEANTELNLGVAKSKLGYAKESVIDLLQAEVLGEHKGFSDKNKGYSNVYAVLEWNFRKLGMRKEADIYQHKLQRLA